MTATPYSGALRPGPEHSSDETNEAIVAHNPFIGRSADRSGFLAAHSDLPFRYYTHTEIANLYRTWAKTGGAR